jgi:hypothetical protein
MITFSYNNALFKAHLRSDFAFTVGSPPIIFSRRFNRRFFIFRSLFHRTYTTTISTFDIFSLVGFYFEAQGD